LLIGFCTVTYLSRFNVAFGCFFLAWSGLEAHAIVGYAFVVWDFIVSVAEPTGRLSDCRWLTELETEGLSSIAKERQLSTCWLVSGWVVGCCD